jgi:RNA polymerase sigma-70 factor (ECF subfamily)
MWPTPPETGKLLDQVRRGERSAIDQLFARHREPVRRMVELRLDRAVAARFDASDIVQEVLLEASRRLEEYLRDAPLPFHLWLRQIARDRLIDAHRRHRRAERRTVDRERSLAPADHSSVEWAAHLIDRELTPATAALRREIESRFQSALDDVDDDTREIILMRHFEQLSNQEVAQALGLSEPAASMRYLRAIRKLRDLLLPGDASGR